MRPLSGYSYPKGYQTGYRSRSQMQLKGINAVKAAATMLTPAKPEASKTYYEMAAATAMPVCDAALRIAVNAPRMSAPRISVVSVWRGACRAEAATPRSAIPAQRYQPQSSRTTTKNRGARSRLDQMMTLLLPA